MAEYTVSGTEFLDEVKKSELSEEAKSVINEIFTQENEELNIFTIETASGNVFTIDEVVYVKATTTDDGKSVEITLGDTTVFVDASSSLAALFLTDIPETGRASDTSNSKLIVGSKFGDTINLGKAVANNIDAGAGDDTVTTGAGSDSITAGTGDDSISSGAANDVIRVHGSESGSDTVDAGTGYDEVIINESVKNFDTVVSANNELVLTSKSNGVSKTISNAEYVSFQNADGKTVSVIINTNSAVESSVARLYEAFGRHADKAGMEYWANEVDKGNTDLVRLSAQFLDTEEGKSIYKPEFTNEQFLTKAYAKVLDRKIDDAGKQWWLDQMKPESEGGAGWTKAEVLAKIVDDAEATELYNYINTIDGIS